MRRFSTVGWLLASVVILCQIQGREARKCYNCSSVNDHYCPEFMTSEDGDIVPYVSCDSIYDGRFCVKTTGVNGGFGTIRCFRCDDTVSPDNCSHSNLNSRAVSDCADVFEAYYCIKTIQEQPSLERSLGTTRFCSSRDMGNYCEYIRRPGDQLEYRSCVFTCESDGCNTGGHVIGSVLLTILVFSTVHLLKMQQSL